MVLLNLQMLQVFQMQPRSASACELAESSARIRLQKEADRITEELSTQCDHDSWLTTPLFSVELGGDALKLANTKAETNLKQLPPRQQAQLEMPLDAALRSCHHCGKVAKDPV